MLITSRTNSRVKQIRRLSSRKHRDRTRLFFVAGLPLVREAVETGAGISMLVVAPEVLSKEGARQVAAIQERTGAPSLEVAPDVFRSISPEPGPQGIGAVVRQRWQGLGEVRVGGGSTFVAVNQIRQPWSIGNIVRTCDAVGAEGVILVGDSTDPYHPMAVRASLGTIFCQCLVKSSLAELAAWTRRRNCFVVGTSPAASADYREVDYRTPTVLLLGSERVGLSPPERAICDVMVSIPMVGRCESHHVAVAAAVVLYEIFRQNQGGRRAGSRRSRPAGVG